MHVEKERGYVLRMIRQSCVLFNWIVEMRRQVPLRVRASRT
jgi:hypothetical protein